MRDIVIPVVMVSAFAACWYFFWVQPRTEFLMEVMDCMGNETSQDAYNDCAEEVSARHQ